MGLDVWITYIITTTFILVIPGPTIILVISQAVTHGRKSVVPLVAGVVLGDFTAMTLSLLGLGAIMTASPLYSLCLNGLGRFTCFIWGLICGGRTPTVVPFNIKKKISHGVPFLEVLLL